MILPWEYMGLAVRSLLYYRCI